MVIPTQVQPLRALSSPILWAICLSYLKRWTSLGVQWLRVHVPKAGSMGSIPGWGAQIPHAIWQDQKIKINKG